MSYSSRRGDMANGVSHDREVPAQHTAIVRGRAYIMQGKPRRGPGVYVYGTHEPFPEHFARTRWALCLTCSRVNRNTEFRPMELAAHLLETRLPNRAASL